MLSSRWGLSWDALFSLYFIAVWGNYHTAENSFWKKKKDMCYFQGLLLSLILCVWRCIWALSGSGSVIMVRPAPGVALLALQSCAPGPSVGVFITISAAVLLSELPRGPASSSQRSCGDTVVLMTPCLWRPPTLFFLCMHRFLWSAFVGVCVLGSPWLARKSLLN